MSDERSQPDYFTLDITHILATAKTLRNRIEERFPSSGLSGVSGELRDTAGQTTERIARLKTPYWPIRIVSYSVVLITLSLLVYVFFGGVAWSGMTAKTTYAVFIGMLEPTLGAIVFLTAFFVFLTTWERRWKHREVLRSINELRSLAHKIDMFQLTKDPERLMIVGPDTPSSPDRNLTLFELGRYLDYCSEMLSIVTKVSALYAQAFPEPVVLNAVDQLELLSTGLSQKIWQKIMLLKSVEQEGGPSARQAPTAAVIAHA